MIIAKLERRYEELTGGSEAFAARLWRALHPDTTEAPPSHEAIIAEVGGIVAEISRLRAENTALAAQPALQLEAIRAGRIRCEGCGLIVVGGHLACGCCPRCCVCFALEAPHG